jgi:hypothetical protein
MDELLTSISSKHPMRLKQFTDFLIGDSDPPDVTVDLYKDLHKLRHNIVCSIIAHHYGINEIQEKPVSTYLTGYKENESRMTPDLHTFSEGTHVFIEITISVNPAFAKESKIAKYSFLQDRSKLIVHSYSSVAPICDDLPDPHAKAIEKVIMRFSRLDFPPDSYENLLEIEEITTNLKPIRWNSKINHLTANSNQSYDDLIEETCRNIISQMKSLTESMRTSKDHLTTLMDNLSKRSTSSSKRIFSFPYMSTEKTTCLRQPTTIPKDYPDDVWFQKLKHGPKKISQTTERDMGVPRKKFNMESKHNQIFDPMLSAWVEDLIKLTDWEPALRSLQCIAQELSIHGSMKLESKLHRILHPFDGVMIHLASFGTLRGGVNQSTIWMRFAVKNGIRKEGFLDGTIHHGWLVTGWTSMKTTSLDHYSRIYDMWKMSTSAFLETMTEYRKTTIEEELKREKMFCGLIAALLLENKRSTSVITQQSRYVMMHCLSTVQNWKEISEKLDAPARTPLAAWVQRMLIMYPFSFRSKVKMDEKSMMNIIEAEYHGSRELIVPRMFETGNLLPFRAALCQMYVSLLFNKDAGNKTHDSLIILKKIADGEEWFKNDFNSCDRKDQLLGKCKAFIDPNIIEIVSKKHFRKKISGGSGMISACARHKDLNKPIIDLATLKSSSPHYTIFEAPFHRSKCLLEAEKLILANDLTLQSVIEKNCMQQTTSQVFNKNQVGGAREIHILDFISRCKINSLETFSRKICELIPEEMLTKGKEKTTIMLHNMRETIKGSPYYMSMDMSKWGPSLYSRQFYHMFRPYKDEIGPLFHQIEMILADHSNKRILYPNDLMIQWRNNPDKEHDGYLNDLKLKYQIDKKPYFEQVSNMWQGILHYTSSLYHGMCLTMCDDVISRLLSIYGIPQIQVSHQYSSDDRTSYFTLARHKVLKMAQKSLIDIVYICVPKLFNIKTSFAKSCLSPIIAEFNSIFSVYPSTLPVTFKYALRSVPISRTDSPGRCIVDLISAVNQLRENGGSKRLSEMAHDMNRKFVKSMYNQANMTAYQFGCYPDMDADLIDLYGAEIWNYKLIKDGCLKTSQLVPANLLDMQLEIADSTTNNYQSLNIHLKTGINTKAKLIRRSLSRNKQHVEEKLLMDPLYLMIKPTTKEDCLIHIAAKAWTTGFIESIQGTNPSLWLGRSTIRSDSKIFIVSGKELNFEDLSNYDSGINVAINELFPLWETYDEALKPIFYKEQLSDYPMPYKPVTIRHTIRRKYISSKPSDLVKALMNSSDVDLTSQLMRDMQTIKEEIKSNFKFKTASSVYWLYRYVKHTRSRVHHWFTTGRSTQGTHDTMIMLKEHPNATTYGQGIGEALTTDIRDHLTHMINHLCIESLELAEPNPSCLDYLTTDTSQMFGINYSKLLACSAVKYKKPHILQEIRTPLVYWDIEQKTVNGVWSGDFMARCEYLKSRVRIKGYDSQITEIRLDGNIKDLPGLLKEFHAFKKPVGKWEIKNDFIRRVDVDIGFRFVLGNVAPIGELYLMSDENTIMLYHQGKRVLRAKKMLRRCNWTGNTIDDRTLRAIFTDIDSIPGINESMHIKPPLMITKTISAEFKVNADEYIPQIPEIIDIDQSASLFDEDLQNEFLTSFTAEELTFSDPTEEDIDMMNQDLPDELIRSLLMSDVEIVTDKHWTMWKERHLWRTVRFVSDFSMQSLTNSLYEIPTTLKTWWAVAYIHSCLYGETEMRKRVKYNLSELF